MPEVELDEGNEDAPTAAANGISTLRNSLLPDGSLSARFTTTAGPDLKQVSGSVYVGSHDGVEQRVLWIRIDERLIPTGWPLLHAFSVY